MSTTSIPPETPTETTHPFTDAERAELGDRLAMAALVPVFAAQLGDLARRLRANADCEQCAKGLCAYHGKIR